MSDPIIIVQNLSKSYFLKHKNAEHYIALRDVLTNKIKAIFNPTSKISNLKSEEFWALKDVSFEIKQGERVGIIGRNGAGKSTLLKVLSRIVTPTKGRVTIDGRVASLLEVGTGFHPELTGRENIFLNGSIVGMSKAEIKKKFDEIVAFSEVEKFLDTPVKRFSSGMYVRLAFAVAAHLEPEILLIDEVLAVGDSSFQKKCLGKMEDVSKREGRTVLFVSHSMETVLRLCNKTILLDNGEIKQIGPTETVIKSYLNTGTESSSYRSWLNSPNIPSNNIVKLRKVSIHNESYEIKATFEITKKIGVSMEYEVLEDGDIFTHSFNFYNEEGVNVFNTHDVVSDLRTKPRSKGIYTTTMWIPENLLAEGVVVVGVAIIKIEPFTIYYHEKEAVSFNVIDYMKGDSARGNYTLGFPGMVRPLCKWETEKREMK